MPDSTVPDPAKYIMRLFSSLWSITVSQSPRPNSPRAIASPTTANMDTLLSLAFANISSSDLSRIRKGLRQIEGILAQICLSSPGTQSPSKRRASLLQPPSATPSKTDLKTLADLPSDPAFLTFYQLQDTFSHNLTSRLISTLERLLGHPNSTTTTGLLLSTLTLLHGILLLHPPSRSLLATQSATTLLLDLLEPSSPPELHAATLDVLASALLGGAANARAFDDASDGLATVASLYNATATDAFVRAKIDDVWAVYMLPENNAAAAVAVSRSEPSTAVRRERKERKDSVVVVERRASTLNGDEGGGNESTLWDVAAKGTVTRTKVEKKKLLARYIGNVEEVLDMGRGLGLVDSAG